MKIFSKYVNESISNSIKRKIDQSNKVNGALVVIFITVFFIDVAAVLFSDIGYNTDYLRSFFALLLCLVNLILNYYGYFRLSRVLLLYLLPLIVLFVIPITGGRVINEYFFWYPYIPVVASVLPYFQFYEESEKKWLFATLAFYLFLILISDDVLIYFSDNDLSIIPIVAENKLFYKLSAMMIFVFINITLFHIFQVSKKYEVDLTKAKDLIDAKNDELKKKNKELNKINATKDKFFHIIGHDLRSPIAQVIQIAHLLQDSENKLSKEKYNQIIKALNESSTLSYNLLNDLFNWAQTQTGEIVYTPVKFNLFDLVVENVRLKVEDARLKNISIINNIPKSLMIVADINMLNTIFRNLLSNAIKFTYHDGKIEVNCKQVNNGIEISVQDNGKGILAENINKLFKIDAKISDRGTDNEKGTGIGLVLCKEFVDYHNGKIWVESELEKGSTFFVFLPQ